MEDLSSSSSSRPVKVREVWAHNPDREFALIRSALPSVTFAALDTEFPGHVVKLPPATAHLAGRLPPAATYSLMKQNVDALKIIQVGLSLSDASSHLPHFDCPFSYVWEFNFSDFSPESDCHNPESIALLKNQGINFEKNREKGISSADFVRHLVRSGLICAGNCLSWVTFHGAYDFALLVKILTRRPLSATLPEFLILLNHFFGPKVYDLKHMIKSCDGLYGGVERVAKTLEVERAAGKSHQAGSDSLLTLQTFFRLVQSGRLPGAGGTALLRFCSVLFGLETPIIWKCYPVLAGAGHRWDSVYILPPCYDGKYRH